MSENAIFNTTEALKLRLQEAVGAPVYVGPPIKDDVGELRASLFLFNVVPNRDLRNVERVVPPSGGSAPGAAGARVDALPVDLRFLISVFRMGNDHNELTTLGKIMLALHREPNAVGQHSRRADRAADAGALHDRRHEPDLGNVPGGFLPHLRCLPRVARLHRSTARARAAGSVARR